MASSNESKMRAMLEGAGVPLRFREKTFADFVSRGGSFPEALESLVEYAADWPQTAKGRSMILCGGTGSGKTHAACAMVREVLEAKQSASYVLFKDACRRVRDAWKKRDDASELTVISGLCSPTFLALDDVSIDTDFERALLEHIINDRYANLRATMLVTSHEQQQFLKMLGNCIIDRLREDGGFVVGFRCDSFRDKMHKQ